MAKGFKHLDLEKREAIEEGVTSLQSASEISRGIGVSASTVTREVEGNRFSRAYSPGPGKAARDLCARYDGCAHAGDVCGECGRNGGAGRCRACGAGRCYEHCPDFLAGPRCAAVLSWPHTCDGCASAAGCGKPKIWYRAHRAQEAADARKSAPRKGICCTQGELEAMDALVTPLVKKGQSPEAVWAEHAAELPVSCRTYYRYMGEGITSALPIDLPRKVRRKQARAGRGERSRIDRSGRTYEDFLGLPEAERMSAWQGDTVVGRAGDSQRILSLHLPRISFQAYLLLASGASAEVVAALDALEGLMGSAEAFRAAVPVLLVDRGPEFDDWAGMERSRTSEGESRCRVFYTDPQRPDQKGACERNHSELRRILPKGGTDFDALSARDVALACSHVNSYPRPALGGARPMDLAALVLPDALTSGIGLAAVAPDEVVLRPGLVPHAMAR